LGRPEVDFAPQHAAVCATVESSTAPRLNESILMGWRSPDRRALVLASLSLVVCISWELFRSDAHPFGGLTPGAYTDHISHMNAARLFPRLGRDLWRRGIRDLVPLATPTERAQLPPDVQPNQGWTGGIYVVPGWPADKPAVMSWSTVSRPYPPGDLLLVAPAALLFHFTSMSATVAYRLTIVLLLL
jgi:hypothetical protein